MKNLIIAALLLAPAAAGAQGNIKFGNLEVNPFVSTQETYDNNIYLENTGKDGSLINRSVLGVDLLHKLGSRYSLNGGYNMELITYSKAPGTNNAVHHNASLGAKASLPKSMTLTVDDKYTKTTDQSTTQDTERAKRQQNTLGVNLEAPLRGKFGFGVAVSHVYHDYDAVAFDMLDRSELMAGFDLNYKWQPKTRLFLSYRHGIMAYKTAQNGDAGYDNVEVGATGQIAPKVQGTVKAGAQFRNYYNEIAGAKTDSAHAQYSAQAVWKAIEKTDVTLYAKRGTVETSYGLARYYTSTLTDLSVSREIRKIKAGLGFNFEDVRYSEKNTVTDSKKRLDENFGARLTAEYSIQKWLVANFGYHYKQRGSNFNQFEYKDNTVSLGLKAMF